jgi:hypothetical protein
VRLTPAELQNPHPRPFYRQVIRTRLAAEVFSFCDPSM